MREVGITERQRAENTCPSRTLLRRVITRPKTKRSLNRLGNHCEAAARCTPISIANRRGVLRVCVSELFRSTDRQEPSETSQDVQNDDLLRECILAYRSSRAFVASSGEDKVAIVDLKSLAVTGEISPLGQRITNLDMDRDSSSLSLAKTTSELVAAFSLCSW